LIESGFPDLEGAQFGPVLECLLLQVLVYGVRRGSTAGRITAGLRFHVLLDQLHLLPHVGDQAVVFLEPGEQFLFLELQIEQAGFRFPPSLGCRPAQLGLGGGLHLLVQFGNPFLHLLDLGRGAVDGPGQGGPLGDQGGALIVEGDDLDLVLEDLELVFALRQIPAVFFGLLVQEHDGLGVPVNLGALVDVKIHQVVDHGRRRRRVLIPEGHFDHVAVLGRGHREVLFQEQDRCFIGGDPRERVLDEMGIDGFNLHRVHHPFLQIAALQNAHFGAHQIVLPGGRDPPGIEGKLRAAVFPPGFDQHQRTGLEQRGIDKVEVHHNARRGEQGQHQKGDDDLVFMFENGGQVIPNADGVAVSPHHQGGRLGREGGRRGCRRVRGRVGW